MKAITSGRGVSRVADSELKNLAAAVLLPKLMAYLGMRDEVFALNRLYAGDPKGFDAAHLDLVLGRLSAPMPVLAASAVKGALDALVNKADPRQDVRAATVAAAAFFRQLVDDVYTPRIDAGDVAAANEILVLRRWIRELDDLVSRV